jgi:hypothetical protein
MDPEKFKPNGKYRQVPITIEDTKPFVQTNITINKKKSVKLLIDTGASHSLILDPESDEDIKVPEKHISTIIGRALGGEIKGKIGRIQSLELGKYSLPDVLANYPDRNSYMDTLKASSVIRNGAIGGDILSRFTVVFNYSREMMYLKKNISFKKEFQHNLSGLTIKAKGARLKVFEVVEVRKGSVSERAEIVTGDILNLINNIPVSSYDLNEIIGILNSKPGKKISLVVERNGVKMKKTLVLEKEI